VASGASLAWHVGKTNRVERLRCIAVHTFGTAGPLATFLDRSTGARPRVRNESRPVFQHGAEFVRLRRELAL